MSNADEESIRACIMAGMTDASIAAMGFWIAQVRKVRAGMTAEGPPSPVTLTAVVEALPVAVIASGPVELIAPVVEIYAAPLSEIPDTILRYCRWFLAARWSLRDVAWLFDLEPEALAAVA
jgi:hypothetical protein